MGCGIITCSSRSKKSIARRLKNICLEPEIFLGVRNVPTVDNYEILEILGSGGFSEVALAIHNPTNQKRALKIIRKSPLAVQQLNPEFMIIEMKLLRTLDHPNVLKCFEIFEDKENYFLALEYCEGGNLFQKLGPNLRDETRIADIIYQILSGIAYFHDKQIVHRDIKPENILIESSETWNVKVADFGSACYLDKNKIAEGVFGSPFYLAPEVLLGYYDEKVDIWSLGVVLYVMVTGLAPYSGKNVKEIVNQIIDCPLRINAKTMPGQSLLMLDFARQLLEINPSRRISAKDALQHPWIKRNAKSKTQNTGIPINICSKPLKSKLAQGVFMYIVSCLLKSKDFCTLSNAFREIDTNGNGKIEPHELENELKKLHPDDDAKKKTINFFKDFDYNNNNFIEFTEFIMACSDHQCLFSNELIGGAFEKFDEDGDGIVDLNDIEKVIGPLELKEDCNFEIKGRFDKKKTIDKKEFIDLIKSLAE
ncbi:hypothetical protein SteCoe_5664 [Stentor coeruleus]|uniref:non-specific serine/threonine protein kinase n=1 Tax=Stentor coeruleus TaxID=5963 RepID=A0A1R2CS21_9CILI|nr:hypothetical protein SteCoe_5664 [Stentor coeruleus]